MLSTIILSMLLTTGALPALSLPITTADGNVIGTGILVDDTFALTVYHVMAADDHLFAKCPSGNQPLQLVRSRPSQDLALVHLTKPCGLKPAVLALYDAIPGQEVWTVGCPEAKCGWITHGVVSGYQSIDGFQRLVSDAPVFFGSSGGSLIDSEDRVVGITHGFFCMEKNNVRFQQCFSFHTSASALWTFLETN